MIWFFDEYRIQLIAGESSPARYIWPELHLLPRVEALPSPHPAIFRFIGLALLVPGVVSPDLPLPSALRGLWGHHCAILALVSLLLCPVRLALPPHGSSTFWVQRSPQRFLSGQSHRTIGGSGSHILPSAVNCAAAADYARTCFRISSTTCNLKPQCKKPDTWHRTARP